MKLLPCIIITLAAASIVFAEPEAASQVTHPQSAPANPRIDYHKFLQIAGGVEPERASKRLTEAQWLAAAAEKGTIVLDARSADKYALRHLKGAVSLPFTDFTEEALAKVIPDKATKVLIYCNNNFEGSPRAFAEKTAAASLNISTYISLATYGYTNVWELAPLLDVNSTALEFEGLEVSEDAAPK